MPYGQCTKPCRAKYSQEGKIVNAVSDKNPEWILKNLEIDCFAYICISAIFTAKLEKI
jgi:hypothetical protein